MIFPPQEQPPASIPLKPVTQASPFLRYCFKMSQQGSRKVQISIQSGVIVFCYQNCSKKAWKSVRKNGTSVNKKFFQLNQGWKRTSRKRFLRPRPFLRSRPKAETEKWRPRPRNVSEMSFFNRGLIENIFYSHESFFITLFKAFLEQFW